MSSAAPPGEVAGSSMTSALTLLGLLLVLLAIPLAFSLAPLVIGTIVLAYGLRRAHVGLSATA
jgi:hypothetical protein